MVVLVVLVLFTLKLNVLFGWVDACSILSSVFDICSKRALMTSGNLHPNVLASARALSTWWLSSSVEKSLRPIAKILAFSLAISSILTVRVLMSAAVS